MWHSASSITTDIDSDTQLANSVKFLYLPVKIANIEVSALIDTGSSINILSSQLFNNIPDSFIARFKASSDKITLANNQSIKILGAWDIKISTT